VKRPIQRQRNLKGENRDKAECKLTVVQRSLIFHSVAVFELLAASASMSFSDGTDSDRRLRRRFMPQFRQKIGLQVLTELWLPRHLTE
jgi:hypothetical protein